MAGFICCGHNGEWLPRRSYAGDLSDQYQHQPIDNPAGKLDDRAHVDTNANQHEHHHTCAANRDGYIYPYTFPYCYDTPDVHIRSAWRLRRL